MSKEPDKKGGDICTNHVVTGVLEPNGCPDCTTDKKGRDIIEWEGEFDSEFLNPDKLSSKGAFRPDLQGRLIMAFKSFITDLLTRQANKSYKQGFSDAYEQYKLLS